MNDPYLEGFEKGRDVAHEHANAMDASRGIEEYIQYHYDMLENSPRTRAYFAEGKRDPDHRKGFRNGLWFQLWLQVLAVVPEKVMEDFAQDDELNYPLRFSGDVMFACFRNKPGHSVLAFLYSKTFPGIEARAKGTFCTDVSQAEEPCFEYYSNACAEWMEENPDLFKTLGAIPGHVGRIPATARPYMAETTPAHPGLASIWTALHDLQQALREAHLTQQAWVPMGDQYELGWVESTGKFYLAYRQMGQKGYTLLGDTTFDTMMLAIEVQAPDRLYTELVKLHNQQANQIAAHVKSMKILTDRVRVEASR